jgi:hypothetical protein
MLDEKPKKGKKKKEYKKVTLGPSSGIVKLRNTRVEEIERYGNKGKKT